MENESRFCVGFYCGLRSTQRTVVIESIIELTLIIACRMYKVNFFQSHSVLRDYSGFVRFSYEDPVRLGNRTYRDW